MLQRLLLQMPAIPEKYRHSWYIFTGYADFSVFVTVGGVNSPMQFQTIRMR